MNSNASPCIDRVKFVMLRFLILISRSTCPEGAAPSLASRGSSTAREVSLQFVERAGPALLVAAARTVVGQKRMCEGQFRAFGDCAEPDLDARHAGVFLAAFPTPTHCDAFGPDEFEIFAAALVLGAVEHAEAHAVAAAHAYVRLRQKHRPRVRTPPLRDAFGRGDSIENDR